MKPLPSKPALKRLAGPRERHFRQANPRLTAWTLAQVFARLLNPRAVSPRREYFQRYHRERYVPVQRQPGSHRGKQHPVMRSDGVPFPSLAAAVRACGGKSHTTILAAIERQGTAFGFRWRSLAHAGEAKVMLREAG